MQAQQQKVDVLPRWMTKAKLQTLMQMEPEEALEEALRLRAAFNRKRRDNRAARKEIVAQQAKKWSSRYKAKRRKTSRARLAKIKIEDPNLYRSICDKKNARDRVRRLGKEQVRTDAMREKDRRKYQRIKAQDFARANHTEMRKLICVHVPGYLMAAAQMDVINSVMVQILDRKVPFNELAAWVKKSVTEYNRQFDYFKTVSIDAPIAGTDGLTRGDMLSNDTPHF